MEGKDLYDGFSPAQGLTEGISTSGGGDPATPSVYPEVNVYGTDLYASAPVGNKPAEEFAGVGPTGMAGVSLADAPEGSSDDSLGATLVAGLGDPPRP